MGSEEHSNFPKSPLTEVELEHIRRIMQADDRARWLWASARAWATWITAVTIGLYAAKQAIFDMLSGIKK